LEGERTPVKRGRHQSEVPRLLAEHRQEHLLRWLDSLSGEERSRLLEDLARLDYARIEDFRSLINTPPTDISFSDVAPPRVERVPLTEAQQTAEQRVIRLGRKALKADRVAALTVAGGQGTRLRYDQPKGTYPISPVRKLCFFGLFAEQILAARRRYGCRMPWFVMTAASNDGAIRSHFEGNAFFGLGSDTVHFFTQRSNPILDTEGRLLLAEKDRLLTGPDGHGGVFEALRLSGLLELAREGGWDLISYFQVDNPLVIVADPRFLGHHLRRGADFSCKVVPKRDPGEGLGLAVRKSSRAAIVEYLEVPEYAAVQRAPSGKLRFTYGNIAIHIMSVPFIERVVQQQDVMPWHVARRQYEVLDANGHKAPSEPEGCCKFERFVFDALPLADDCAFVEVRRDTEFAPVKNATGVDSPDMARSLMQRKWLQWIRSAGVTVGAPKDLSQPVVEISPLFASDEEELKERIEPGWEPSFPLVLEP
jgi:UDP-N-acetylglucosamine/UDP-N-acetylgalactosamine diphosphorylase